MKTLGSIKQMNKAEDFWANLDDFWKDYDNMSLFQLDLQSLSEKHLELLEQNTQLLKSDLNTSTQAMFDHSIHFGEIHQLQHDSEAYGIHILNDYEQIYIVGDIHSDDLILRAFFDQIQFFRRASSGESFKVVFMGDYVDRGYSHLKTMEVLLSLKLMFPSHILMLRGNHDGGKFDEQGELKLPYRIPEQDDPLWYFPKYLIELSEKNATFSKDLIMKYFEFFDALPYTAVIQTDLGNYACIHGGLPKPYLGFDSNHETRPYDHITSISALTMLSETDNVGASIIENLMWSDPYRGEGELKRNMRRFYFTEDDFDAFSSRFGIAKLFRGHEVVTSGLRVHFEGKTFTVFSSGKTKSSFYQYVNPAFIELSPSGAYKMRRML